jgi:hypothetical protein
MTRSPFCKPNEASLGTDFVHFRSAKSVTFPFGHKIAKSCCPERAPIAAISFSIAFPAPRADFGFGHVDYSLFRGSPCQIPLKRGSDQPGASEFFLRLGRTTAAWSRIEGFLCAYFQRFTAMTRRCTARVSSDGNA